MVKLTEHTFAVPEELEPGILRLTLPLPTGPRHVHCYLLEGEAGYLLVDTGLGLMETPWTDIVGRLDRPVTRIFITHMHPDHVGGAEAAAEATGASSSARISGHGVSISPRPVSTSVQPSSPRRK